MTDYVGSAVVPLRAGLVGAIQPIVGQITFSGATLAANPTDTYLLPNLLANRGAAVPIIVHGFELYSSTTTPALLVAEVGNADDTDGFMVSKGLTATGQLVRIGDGALIGRRITNATPSMTVTTAAGAAYTGSLFYRFWVEACLS